MPAETETKELIVINELTPADVFKPNGLDGVIGQIQTALASLPPADPATEKGRKEIASRAARIAKSKTYIDRIGKEYGEDLRARINVINAERKRAWDILETIQHEVRKPVTEFEERAKARIAAHEASIAAIEYSAEALRATWPNETVADLKAGREAYAQFRARDWEEFAARAAAILDAAEAEADGFIAKREAMEAERAELDRLRKEAEAREREDRERRIAEEAAAKAKAEAEAAQRMAEERAAQAERDKAEAVARMERERIEAEERAAREKAEAEARAKAQSEAAARAERDRIEAERVKAAAEAAKREADEKHRADVHAKIHMAIVECGADHVTAASIVTALSEGKIPGVTVAY